MDGKTTLPCRSRLTMGRVRITHWSHACTHAGTSEWSSSAGWPSSPVHHAWAQWHGPPVLDTPFTSSLNGHECVALLRLGVSVYSTSTCRDPPLLVALRYALDGRPALTGVLWILLDCSTAALLAATAMASRRRRSATELALLNALPPEEKTRVLQAPGGLGSADLVTMAIAAGVSSSLWMLNPVAILACTHGSATTVHAALALVVVHALSHRRVVAATVAATLVGTLSVYHGVLLIPTAIVAWETTAVPLRSGCMITVAALVCTCTAVMAVSHELDGSWQWIDAVHLAALRVDDYTPNVGLCWYLLTETFPHYRGYFLALVHINGVVAATMLTLRLRRDAVFAAMVLLSVFAMCKTYPTLSDFAIVVALFVGRPELWPFVDPCLFYLCTNVRCECCWAIVCVCV